MIRGTSAKWMSWTGIAVGAFVVLVGLATLAGMPWRYTAVGGVGTGLQILGTVAAIGLGIALAWLGVTSARRE